MKIQSAPPPPNTADLGTDEKAAIFGNRRYWDSYIITYKSLIWDLEMGGGIGGGCMGGGGTTVCFYLGYLMLPGWLADLAEWKLSHC